MAPAKPTNPTTSANITAHTDRAGVTTHRDYDSMGRITHLHEPAGDSVAWNDTYTVTSTSKHPKPVFKVRIGVMACAVAIPTRSSITTP